MDTTRAIVNPRRGLYQSRQVVILEEVERHFTVVVHHGLFADPVECGHASQP
jgi:hypothetical protein